ncbi:hypothetical protein CaCOL14_006072 [Colletotrichum acutatum]
MPKLLWISWDGNLFGDESGLGDLSMPPDVIGESLSPLTVATLFAFFLLWL